MKIKSLKKSSSPHIMRLPACSTFECVSTPATSEPALCILATKNCATPGNTNTQPQRIAAVKPVVPSHNVTPMNTDKFYDDTLHIR